MAPHIAAHLVRIDPGSAPTPGALTLEGLRRRHVIHLDGGCPARIHTRTMRRRETRGPDMARQRGRRSSSSGGFAGWGILIAVALLVATWQRSWSVGLGLALVLVAYLCWIHPSNCRVQKLDGDPCSQPSSGWLGTCRRHRTMKSSLPTMSRTPGHLWPQVWWPRPGGAAAAHGPPLPPRRPRSSRAPSRAPNGGTRIVTILAVASLVVAIMSFLRDVIAG